MEKKKSFNLLLIFMIIEVILIVSFSCFSLAYFSFRKVFEGNGNLPILNLAYTITKGSESDLKNNYYNGQTNNEVEVTLNTLGNNISGYVRVKIGISWSGSLTNTTYNQNYELIQACKIEYNSQVWEYKNGYYYLKNPMEKDSSVVLFSNIIFDNLGSEYRGNKVDITLIPEIYQTQNLPENW